MKKSYWGDKGSPGPEQASKIVHVEDLMVGFDAAGFKHRQVEHGVQRVEQALTTLFDHLDELALLLRHFFGHQGGKTDDAGQNVNNQISEILTPPQMEDSAVGSSK